MITLSGSHCNTHLDSQIDYGKVLTAVSVSTCVRPLPDDPNFCLELNLPATIEVYTFKDRP